jgi:hypothetical protein
MKKLLSFCDDPWSKGKFNSGGVEHFLEEMHFDGVELMKWGSPGSSVLTQNRVFGQHLLFWPMWLDFWREDRSGNSVRKTHGGSIIWRHHFRSLWSAAARKS